VIPHQRPDRPHKRNLPRKRWRPLLLLLALTVSLSAMLASVAAAPAATGNRFELELPAGNLLTFIPIFADDGTLAGYGIAETVPPDGASYRTLPGLAEADPAEVANAFVRHGDMAPDVLLALYGPPELGQAGWGLELETPWAGQFPCLYPAIFNDDFPGFQHQQISYFDGPQTEPGDWTYNPYDRYQTERYADLVSDFHAKVTRCYNVPKTRTSTEPEVYLGYRRPFSGWQTIPLGKLSAAGATVSFTWYPPYPGSTAIWKLIVIRANQPDQFHLGMAWE